MTKENFCEILQTTLNEESKILPETNFKELDSFGSLSSVLVLQLIEDQLGIKLNPRIFRTIKSVNDLAGTVGSEILN